MHKRYTFLKMSFSILALLLFLSWSAGAQAMAQGTKEKSLYERLGGYDAIAAVVDDFIGRLVADKRFDKFFVGHSEDSLKKIRQHVVDQFCAAAGLACTPGAT